MPDYRMIGYIHESPEALAKTLEANEMAVGNIAQRCLKGEFRRVIISGVGSSYTAAVIAAPAFIRFSPLPVHVLPSTEVGAYLPSLVDAHTLVIAVSRSGERGWVVDSFREAIARGATGIALTGRRDNLLAQSAGEVFITQEGPESSFPKTKSVLTCAGLLTSLALALADAQDEDAQAAQRAMREIPKQVEETLRACEPQVQELVPQLGEVSSVMLGGSAGNYGVALEGALKMQEASGLTVVANETGNILHGPWGVSGAGWLTALLVSAYDQRLCEKVLWLAGKTGGRRLVVAEPGLKLSMQCENQIDLPVKTHFFLSGLLTLAPVQLLTYYWAVVKGLDPDSPNHMGAILEAMLPPGRQEPE